jgi:recombination protein RecA
VAKTEEPKARKTVDELIAKINKKQGFGVLVRGSELLHEELPRVTTGSLALDYALGGGWPLNQWNEIIGDESHGKTTLVLKTIAANQAKDPDYFVLWIASEHFVAPWARQLGVDLERVYIFNSNVMEECYEVVLEWLDNQACDAVVIDSLANLVPGDEAEKTMTDFQVGLGARLTGKFSRKATVASRRSLIEQERDCLVLIVNQFREKIGVMYGDPRTTPGGRAKNYAFFTRVEVRRDDWIEGPSKVKVGLVIKARTIKNKTAPQQRVAQVDFYFEDSGAFHAGDYDIGKDIVNTAHAMGVLEQRVSAYRFGDRKWVGKPSVVASVMEEMDLREELWAAVLAKASMPVGGVEEPEEEPPPPKPTRALKKAPAPAQPAPRRLKRGS